jgi:hypothetical protein
MPGPGATGRKRRTIQSFDLGAAQALAQQCRDEVAHAALGAIRFDALDLARRVVAHECAFAARGQDHAAVLELLVGARDRIAVQLQVAGELAHGG